MKKVLKYLLASTLTIIIGIIGFIAYVHTFFFEYTEHRNFTIHSTDEEYYEAERLKTEGYSINYPKFHNTTSLTSPEYEGTVYTTINTEIKNYVISIAKSFKNYAKLDYIVDIKQFDTLTVKFYGYGYFYEDREPELLDKTFVYDISNVSASNPPRLILEM